MKEKMPTIVLRIATALFTVAGLVVCVFALPTFATPLVRLYPALAFLQYLVIAGLYLAAACYFYALFQFWLLLNGVDRGELSVQKLNAIRISAAAFSVLYALFAMPIIFLVADADDAPGLILVGALLDMIPIGIAAVAKVLENFVDMKAGMKKERA